MKFLFLSQGKEIATHPGWHDALEKLKEEGAIENFTNIPYFGYAEKHGWENFYRKVVSLVRDKGFDVVYFHYFHAYDKPSPKDCINELINLSDRPIVITSSGDGFSDNWMWPDYPQDFKDVSRLADITFSTQMGKAADKMIKWGARNVVYTPNSMCQVRFSAKEIKPKNHKFDFDVVLVGSNNSSRNPLSKFWWAGRKRNKIVDALYEIYGNRFGLFGSGWNKHPASKGRVAFKDQQETFRRGRIVVGGNPYSYSDYYSSNRIYFEISSGVPTVEFEVPRLSNIIRDKEHCYFVSGVDDMLNTCNSLLETEPEKLYMKAAKAARYIEENHTQYHRMKFKINTVKNYIKNGHKLNVEFPFFLPEVNLEKEKNYALRKF